MDTLSALNSQVLIPSAQNESGKTVEELAAEDAEQQQIDFLELLLTQLEVQNPLDPMDTDEWTAQLTRYSQLEQQIETNEKLVVTNDLLKDSAAEGYFAYIGQGVEVSTNIGVVQDSEAQWSYNIDGQVDDVILTVTDSSGNVISEEAGSISIGVHTYTLDTTGLDVSEGQDLYLYVSTTKDGEQITTETTSHVTVDGLWTDNGQTYLSAGSISFRTEDILKVVDTTTDQNKET